MIFLQLQKYFWHFSLHLFPSILQDFFLTFLDLNEINVVFLFDLCLANFFLALILLVVVKSKVVVFFFIVIFVFNDLEIVYYMSNNLPNLWSIEGN